MSLGEKIMLDISKRRALLESEEGECVRVEGRPGYLLRARRQTARRRKANAALTTGHVSDGQDKGWKRKFVFRKLPRHYSPDPRSHVALRTSSDTVMSVHETIVD